MLEQPEADVIVVLTCCMDAICILFSPSSVVLAPVNLAAVDFDGMIEGEVCFERELANVITLKAEFAKHQCCEKAFIQVDLNNVS